MRNLEKIEEALCDVLQSYAEGGIKSAADVATIKHALSGMVKIRVLEEMDNYSNGFSRRSNEGELSAPLFSKGGLGVEDVILQHISGFGFPSLVCFYLLMKMNGTMEKLTEAITEMNVANEQRQAEMIHLMERVE